MFQAANFSMEKNSVIYVRNWPANSLAKFPPFLEPFLRCISINLTQSISFNTVFNLICILTVHHSEMKSNFQLERRDKQGRMVTVFHATMNDLNKSLCVRATSNAISSQLLRIREQFLSNIRLLPANICKFPAKIRQFPANIRQWPANTCQFPDICQFQAIIVSSQPTILGPSQDSLVPRSQAKFLDSQPTRQFPDNICQFPGNYRQFSANNRQFPTNVHRYPANIFLERNSLPRALPASHQPTLHAFMEGKRR